jgi:hypothetical protein
LAESGFTVKNKMGTFALCERSVKAAQWPLWRLGQEARDGFAIASLRALLAGFPKTECPAPHAHKRAGFLDRQVQPSPLTTKVRRQRIASLAAEFRFARPQ